MHKRIMSAYKNSSVYNNTYVLAKVGLWRRYKPQYQLDARFADGDMVKLVFLLPKGSKVHAERMWVEIIAMNSQGVFSGRLDNDPLYVKGLRCNDIVHFRRHHIYDKEV